MRITVAFADFARARDGFHLPHQLPQALRFRSQLGDLFPYLAHPTISVALKLGPEKPAEFGLKFGRNSLRCSRTHG
jgi:hypothetical protein